MITKITRKTRTKNIVEEESGGTGPPIGVALSAETLFDSKTKANIIKARHKDSVGLFV